MKFGIIGSGNSATNIVRSLSVIDNARIIGITSKNLTQAKQLAGQESVRIENIIDDTTLLLENPEIEAVIISVPHHLHFPLVMDALNAGKHVLCEKPLAITVKQGEEMIGLAKEKQLKLGTFFQMRFNQSALKAKEIIDHKQLGQLMHAQANVLWQRDQDYYDKSAWRGKWKTEGGGSLINQASHTIDLLIWLLGEPKLVFGMFGAKTHNIEVDDNAASLVLFENDVYASIHTSTSIRPGFPAEIKIYGTDGAIVLKGDTVQFTDAQGNYEEFNYQQATVASENDPKKFSKISHEALLRDFIQSVQDDRPPKVDGYEGMRAIKVIRAIYESDGKKIINLG